MTGSILSGDPKKQSTSSEVLCFLCLCPQGHNIVWPLAVNIISSEARTSFSISGHKTRLPYVKHPYVKHTTKNFVFPYALKSWILYAISMRLSGNTVTRSMSRSIISGVRASAFRTVFAAARRLLFCSFSSCCWVAKAVIAA